VNAITHDGKGPITEYQLADVLLPRLLRVAVEHQVNLYFAFNKSWGS